MKKERNYGIDLLRLVLMYMVCMLHILGQGGVLSASIFGTVQNKIFWFLEIFSYCAVDGFALISGYMATNRPHNYSKIVNMWFQVFFYSFIITLILTIMGVNEVWTVKDMIKSIMPLTFSEFWYFTAYVVLFFAIPILDKFIFSIDQDKSKKALIIFVFLFSFLGTLADPFKSQNGYSAIWLIVLYCIGALAKRIQLFKNKKTITLLCVWGLCIFATWAVYIVTGIQRLINYVSPTILLSGIIMVVLFSRMRFKGTFISKVSPLAFGIYLFQLNAVVWTILKGKFIFVLSKNIFIGVLYVMGGALGIFVLGLFIEFIRSRIAKLLRIPLISEKIVAFLDKVLVKLFVVLR